MKRVWGSLFSLGLSLFAVKALAIDTADVLPAGVRSVSVRMGTVHGLNQSFTETGELKYLGDINRLDFDVDTLARFDSRVQSLRNILNDFEMGLGDQLNLGRLSIDASPELSYVAPIFLYGWSSRLTIGMALPIMNFKNEIHTQMTGSNYGAVRSQIDGAAEDLDRAFAELNLDLQSEFRRTAQEKGYTGLDRKNETYLGDVQLITAYQMPTRKNYKSAMQFLVGLPSGPSPNPNDLTDIEIFGRWTLKPIYIGQRRIHPRSTLTGSLSYQAVLPRSIDKRVPLNSEDELPDLSQTDRLKEDIGDTWAALVATSWEHSQSFLTNIGLSFEKKYPDRYSNSLIGDTGQLEANTSSEATVFKLEFSYSSVQDYLNKKALLPATLSYEVSHVLAGVNLENQIKHELWMSVYF